MKDESLKAQDTRRKVLVAFQGGGAKGISHVGALAALEDLKFNVVGYAGTSAGAMVAALGAAGFTAEEIFSTSGDGHHALKTLDPKIESATKLFGPWGWIFIRALRWVASPRPLPQSRDTRDTLNRVVRRWLACIGCFLVTGAGLFLALGAAHWVTWLSALDGKFWLLIPVALAAAALGYLGLPARKVTPWGLRILMAAIVGGAGWTLGAVVFGWTQELRVTAALVSDFWLVLPILLVFILAFLASGLTTTKYVRNAVDQLLKKKLRSTEPDRDPSSHLDWAEVEKDGLSFRLFEKATGKSLRIIATDVTENNVRIFSAHDTPDVLVADAVCASVGLPMIFRVQHLKVSARDAKLVKRVSLMDGGLLSNLPLWVFDEDRAFDRSILTIGMSLEKDSRADYVTDSVSGKTRILAPHDPSASKPLNPFFWMGRLLDAIISGPGLIHRRAIDGLVLVKVPSGLTMLSFDETHEAFCAEINRAREDVVSELELQIELPDRLRENLKSFRSRLITNLDKAINGPGSNGLALAGLKVNGVWDLGVALAVERPGFRRSLWIDIRVGRPSLERSRETVVLLRDRIEGAAATADNWVITVAPSEPFPSSTWAVALRVQLLAGQALDTAVDADRAVLLYVDSEATGIVPSSQALETFARIAHATLNRYLLDFLKITGKVATRKGDNVEFLEQVLRAQIWE